MKTILLVLSPENPPARNPVLNDPSYIYHEMHYPECSCNEKILQEIEILSLELGKRLYLVRLYTKEDM